MFALHMVHGMRPDAFQENVCFLFTVNIFKKEAQEPTCSCRNQIKKQFIREFITLISERTFSINFKDLRF
jgi:hypothetical protein